MTNVVSLKSDGSLSMLFQKKRKTVGKKPPKKQQTNPDNDTVFQLVW